MGPARKEPDVELYSGRFAMRLRHLREGKKKTAAEMAKAVGVTLGTIYHWESGHSFPKPDLLPILAETLNLKSPRMLFPLE